MTKQVPWGKIIVETFIEDAMLTDIEERILRTRVAGWGRKQQAASLNVSISTVDRTIDTLKKKYDIAQKYNPILPPRKNSAKELWMDDN